MSKFKDVAMISLPSSQTSIDDSISETPPPIYTATALSSSDTQHNPTFDCSKVPSVEGCNNIEEELEKQRNLVHGYFTAISRGNVEFVASLLRADSLIPNTTNEHGKTPLLAAVGAGQTHMVRYLLDIGAEIDAYGVTATERVKIRKRMRRAWIDQHTCRTALQYAAELGHLAIVKLLMERGADDALIAPDGQLALRLAASNNHREIVEYLPSRRGGGYKRWQTKHKTALRRCTEAVHGIFLFGKFFTWDIPRFFVWSVPKHLLVLPLINALKWIKEHWRELPARLAKAGRDVAEGLKKIPAVMWRGINRIPKFVKAVVDVLADCLKYTWRCITRIPKGIKVLLLWVWQGVKNVAGVIGKIIASIASFLHTTCAAILTFMRRVTLADVGRAFMACLRAIFVDVPVKIWEWLCTFSKFSLKALKTTFGCMGGVLWWMITGIFHVLLYIPEKLFDIVKACGSSMKSGGKEVLVWMDPKRV